MDRHAEHDWQLECMEPAPMPDPILLQQRAALKRVAHTKATRIAHRRRRAFQVALGLTVLCAAVSLAGGL